MKRRNYTFALTKENERIIPIVEKYPKFAYIKHDKDKDAETHYHYYIEFPNPRSLASIAGELGIPAHMIEAVYDKKGILAYLTHENAPDKHHYDKSEIISNFDVEIETDKSKEYFLLLDDAELVMEGKMTPREFMTAHINSFTTLSAFSFLRSFFMLSENYGRNVRACPRSEFHVPGTDKKDKSGTK